MLGFFLVKQNHLHVVRKQFIVFWTWFSCQSVDYESWIQLPDVILQLSETQTADVITFDLDQTVNHNSWSLWRTSALDRSADATVMWSLDHVRGCSGNVWLQQGHAFHLFSYRWRHSHLCHNVTSSHDCLIMWYWLYQSNCHVMWQLHSVSRKQPLIWLDILPYFSAMAARIDLKFWQSIL